MKGVTMQRKLTGVLLVVLLGAAALVAVAPAAPSRSASGLPVAQIEAAVQAKGEVSDHVLAIEIDRDDIGNRHIHGVVVTPSFQLNGSLTFQPLAKGRALFNGDLALKPNEVVPFIDALLANHLVFQAEHQHFYDLTPPVWFIHFRAIGDPLTIARAVHAALRIDVGAPSAGAAREAAYTVRRRAARADPGRARAQPSVRAGWSPSP